MEIGDWNASFSKAYGAPNGGFESGLKLSSRREKRLEYPGQRGDSQALLCKHCLTFTKYIHLYIYRVLPGGVQ